MLFIPLLFTIEDKVTSKLQALAFKFDKSFHNASVFNNHQWVL